MNDMEKGVLLLLRSAITGEALALPEGFDLEQSRGLMKRHGVLALGYAGALHCGMEKTSPAMKRLFQDYCTNLLLSERQMKAVGKLYEAFDRAEIAYMPVKGCNMKGLYPDPALRGMGDADILIRLEQYDEIRPLMEALGYRELLESDHELVWESPALLVELHKRLIPSYNPDYYRYYGNGWRLASSAQGTHYYMSAEDEFIYLFTHLAKHYRDGGIGCRHVLDLWVYLRSHPEMDEAYVRGELEKLELLEFYENIRRVIRYWFEEGEADERTAFLSSFLLTSGSWGTSEHHVISAGLRDTAAENSVQKGLLKRYLRVFFPPVSLMQARYPSVAYHPAALPLFWVRRGAEALLFRRKNVNAVMGRMKTASADNIQEYEQALDYVGLRFRFEE